MKTISPCVRMVLYLLTVLKAGDDLHISFGQYPITATWSFKMKNLFTTTIIASLIICSTFAFANDSIGQFNAPEIKIQATKSEIMTLKRGLNDIDANLERIKQQIEAINQKIDNMTMEELLAYSIEIKIHEDQKIEKIHQQIEASHKAIDDMTMEELLDYARRNNY